MFTQIFVRLCTCVSTKWAILSYSAANGTRRIGAVLYEWVICKTRWWVFPLFSLVLIIKTHPGTTEVNKNNPLFFLFLFVHNVSYNWGVQEEMTVWELCRKWHRKTNNTTTLSSPPSPPLLTFSLRGCAKTHFGFTFLSAPLDVDKWPAAEVYTVVITKEMMHLTVLSDCSATPGWPHFLGAKPNASLFKAMLPVFHIRAHVWKAMLLWTFWSFSCVIAWTLPYSLVMLVFGSFWSHFVGFWCKNLMNLW